MPDIPLYRGLSTPIQHEMLFAGVFYVVHAYNLGKLQLSALSWLCFLFVLALMRFTVDVGRRSPKSGRGFEPCLIPIFLSEFSSELMRLHLILHVVVVEWVIEVA